MGQKESKLTRNRLDNLAPNNSDKATRNREKDESRQKLKPIVKGKVIRKKKGAFDKFKEAFLGESENLGDYILYDVLVPAFRDTMSDMAFGDGDNDEPMLREAGFGVAMANAEEKVKAAADYITGSNEEDGVAKAIERFVLEGGEVC